MDIQEARAIFKGPATRNMVHEIVALAACQDPVDAAKDAELAAVLLAAAADAILHEAPGSRTDIKTVLS